VNSLHGCEYQGIASDILANILSDIPGPGRRVAILISVGFWLSFDFILLGLHSWIYSVGFVLLHLLILAFIGF
jgi:hypothetical protein